MNSYQTGKLKNVLFDYESIENLSKEFEQIVSQSTDYNIYITHGNTYCSTMRFIISKTLQRAYLFEIELK